MYCSILPESPRWLLAKGRVEEARKVLERAAKVNGAKLSHVNLEEIAADLTNVCYQTIRLESACM